MKRRYGRAAVLVLGGVLAVGILVYLSGALKGKKAPDAKEAVTAQTEETEGMEIEYPFPEEIAQGYYQSSKLQAEVKLSSNLSGYFLDCFKVNYLECESYQEPAHGFAAKEWCVLGGVGQCTDTDVKEHEVFEQGNLVECSYMDNHMECEKIADFQTDQYSACLYKYKFDLYTAAEQSEEGLDDTVPTTSEYWVVFFSQGEGKPLYMKYFNCAYYPQHVAIDNVPGFSDHSN